MEEEKDILDKLKEIAYEVDWGSVERINGVPKHLAVILEAMDIIAQLRGDNKSHTIDGYITDYALRKMQATQMVEAAKVAVVKEFAEECKSIIRDALRDRGTTNISVMHNEALAFARLDKEIDRFVKQNYGVEL